MEVQMIEECTERELKVSYDSWKCGIAEAQTGKAIGSSEFTKYLAKNAASKPPVGGGRNS